MAEQPADPQEAMEGDQEYDFEEAFERLADMPCKVERIMLLGLQRTKASVIEQELLRIKEGRTLEQIRDAALRAYEELMGLDIFDAVDIVLGEGSQGSDKVTVLARFQEKGVVRLHAGTYVQGTEGSVETSLNLTNPLGYAEQVSLGGELSNQQNTTVTLALTKPRPLGRHLLADLRLHQLTHNYQPWSSYCELVRGGALTLSSEDGTRAITYELGWRRLERPSRAASRSVLDQLGDRLLSAVKLIRRGDTFDSATFPTQGWGYRSETQLAGLGPDANLLRFVRQHFTGKVAFPLDSSGTAALTVSGEAGVLLPWGRGAAAQRSCISDRFFLGGLGPGALRGFVQKGAGPSDVRRPVSESVGGELSPRPALKRDALGGDLFCSLLVALNFKLPSEAMRAAGIHGQVFVNGGSLVGLPGAGRSSVRNAWRELTTTFRWSVGAGICWPTRIGKLELNMCRVLARQPHDQKTGLQFGFVAPGW